VVVVPKHLRRLSAKVEEEAREVKKPAQKKPAKPRAQKAEKKQPQAAQKNPTRTDERLDDDNAFGFGLVSEEVAFQNEVAFDSDEEEDTEQDQAKDAVAEGAVAAEGEESEDATETKNHADAADADAPVLARAKSRRLTPLILRRQMTRKKMRRLNSRLTAKPKIQTKKANRSVLRNAAPVGVKVQPSPKRPTPKRLRKRTTPRIPEKMSPKTNTRTSQLGRSDLLSAQSKTGRG